MDLQSNKKLDFSGQPIFIGMDVHKKSWTVTIMTAYHEHKTYVQVPQTAVLVSYLRHNFPHGEYHCVYEAGFSGFGTCRELRAMGVDCIVINPADVPTGDKEKRRKSDRVDSRKLARTLRSQELTGIYVPSRGQEEGRSLLRTRSAIVREVVRCKQRIRSFLFYYGIDLPSCYDQPNLWSRSFITWLQTIRMKTDSGGQSLSLLVDHLQQGRTLLLEANRKVRELAKSLDYALQATNLRSIPGVGPLTSMILLTELGDIQRFKNLDALCAYVGVIPDQRGSGERETTGELTRRSNRMLRKALVESARIAVRKDPALMQSYYAYCQRMHANKAIVHIMRKLLNRIRHLLLQEQSYQLGKVA